MPGVTVRSSEEEDATRVELDFKKMLATTSAPTPLAALVDVTLRVHGHRLPTSPADEASGEPAALGEAPTSEGDEE